MEYIYSIQEYAICIHMYMLLNTRMHYNKGMVCTEGSKGQGNASFITHSTQQQTNKWKYFNIYFHVFCRLLILMKSCKTKKMKVIRSQQWYSYKIICKSLFIQKYKLGHLLLIKKNSGPCEKKEQKHPHPTSKKQKNKNQKYSPK